MEDDGPEGMEDQFPISTADISLEKPKPVPEEHKINREDSLVKSLGSKLQLCGEYATNNNQRILINCANQDIILAILTALQKEQESKKGFMGRIKSSKGEAKAAEKQQELSSWIQSKNEQEIINLLVCVRDNFILSLASQKVDQMLIKTLNVHASLLKAKEQNSQQMMIVDTKADTSWHMQLLKVSNLQSLPNSPLPSNQIPSVSVVADTTATSNNIELNLSAQ